VRIHPDVFGAGREQVRLALQAEGIPLTMSYPPLHHLETFLDPSGFAPRYRDRTGMQDFASLDLPVVRTLADQTLWFKTSVLMGDRKDCDDLVTAVDKIRRNAHELADLAVTEPGTGGRR
jgi:dTDP-4-amino-4,6-dideoxygalactose transaminase